VLAVAVVVATPLAATAHGDPSSHYLETDVLYPGFADRPTQRTELQLLGLLYAARDAGYPLKVALVAGDQDLTEDPTMLGRPQAYAEFVVGELARAIPVSAPVLVLTPSGYGLAGNQPDADGRLHALTPATSVELLRGLPPVGGTGEAMARAAKVAARRLAAEAGHPLPTHVAAAQPLHARAQPAGGEGSGPGLILPLGVFVGVFLAAAAVYEVQRRFTGESVPG